MEFSRYAVYFTPPAGSALHAFGASVLGWDPVGGVRVPHLDAPGVDIAAITDTPRKYGFHATIKPPFRLAQGCTAEDLWEAFEALAGRHAPVTLPGLALARLGRFLALVPVGQTADLSALASRAVTELDRFRAPATEAELSRRRAARLSRAQEDNLVKWGYPYVLDEFRFHMTLSGRLDDPGPVLEALRPRVQALNLSPFTIGSLTLMGEARDGMFREVSRVALAG
ncbi:MAG: DUF1045 domain-containing protein [Pseudomonadota bacterium]